VSYTLGLFFRGIGQHEHPPLSDLALHFWLRATNFRFGALRIFANILYAGAVWFTAICANESAGSRAYWATLLVSVSWPFSFQYGRISGWYCFCLFLITWVTWSYLRILKKPSPRAFGLFAAVAALLIWSNYFGAIILLLLLADLHLFRRLLAGRCAKPILLAFSVAGVSLIPLLQFGFRNLVSHVSPTAPYSHWKEIIPNVGFPVFSIFGSVAVAPWYLPLSIPILFATLALCAAICRTPGRRWFVYFLISLGALTLSGHMDVKRVLFLLSWLFLAIGLAVASPVPRVSRLVVASVTLLILCGWVGIVSGKHYAVSNLYEPWEKVAQFVAPELRNGATVISENAPFFFYMNYQLGLQKSSSADGAYLGEAIYRSHGYKLLKPSDGQSLGTALQGKVVLVNGSGGAKDVARVNSCDATLRRACKVLGDFNATPDPAISFKRRFAPSVPALEYRTHASWYECPPSTVSCAFIR
jgi:hypothetical protein